MEMGLFNQQQGGIVTAVHRGGGLGAYNSATNLTIAGTTQFTTNSAGSGGGAIALNAGVTPDFTVLPTYTGNTSTSGEADLDYTTDCTVNNPVRR